MEHDSNNCEYAGTCWNQNDETGCSKFFHYGDYLIGCHWFCSSED